MQLDLSFATLILHCLVYTKEFVMLSSTIKKYNYTIPLAIGGLFGVCLFLGSTSYFKKNYRFVSIPAVDFNVSMQSASYESVLSQVNNRQLLSVFNGVYDKYNLAQIKPSQDAKIPKIIHVVWLGSKLPEEYEPFYASWRSYHPDWTILFWTDNEANYGKSSVVVESFDALQALLDKPNQPRTIVIKAVDNLVFDNAEFYNKAINYGERSDILKWEIVYRFGGVYVDTDHECLKPLDLLHHTYDFYTGLQPLDTNRVQLGAALFAARPNHPILESCVQEIKNRQHIVQIILKTGPLHFTQCFLNHACRNENNDIAFPATFFYPCSYEQKDLDASHWMRPESFAIHHWAGSWLKPAGFVNS